MEKAEILKLLTALNVNMGEGGMKEEDAVKLVEEQFKASNMGLITKRDELLANEVKAKEKITALETQVSASNAKIGELDAQLKKGNPDKKFFEDQLAEAKTKFEQDLAGITSERDKFRDSHYTRIRDDAIATATKDLQFIDGLRDGFISLAMTRNHFTPKEIDGKINFYNQDNKSIEGVLHELSVSKEGKAYLKNLNQGSGAQGGSSSGQASGSSGSGNSMSLDAFDALSDTAKMEFITKGGTIAKPQ